MMWVIAFACMCLAGAQQAVCSNMEYNLVTRFQNGREIMSSFPEPFRYANCKSVVVGGQNLRLCDAFACGTGNALNFQVKEVDPNNEFSLRFCECGKPIPPVVVKPRSSDADPNADFDPFGSVWGGRRRSEESVLRDEKARVLALSSAMRLGACGKAPSSKWSSGCPQDEVVTQCIGGVWPGLKIFADLMSKTFFGSWRGRTYDCTYVGKEKDGEAFPPYKGGTLSDHADGAAWDAIVKEGNFVLGNQIADFVCRNWNEIGVKYAIFNGRRCTNGVWAPLRSGNPHTHAIHVSLMRLSAMYLTEAEMTQIIRNNGLEPKYPIYEYENEVQAIGANDDPQFILPVPKRTIFFRGASTPRDVPPPILGRPPVTPRVPSKPTKKPIRSR